MAHPIHRIAAVVALGTSLFALGCGSGQVAGQDGATSPDMDSVPDTAVDGPGNDGPSNDAVAADVAIDVVLPPGAVRVTIVSDPIFGGGQGYDISANQVLESGNEVCAATADFCLNARQILSLGTGGASGPFCKKGTVFTSVLDVPIDPTGCLWGVADLGGPFVHLESRRAGTGFLFRDRDGVLAARLVIVADRIHEDTHGEVTFDLVRIEAK